MASGAASKAKNAKIADDAEFRGTLSLSELDKMEVYDADNNAVAFGSLHKDTTSIIVFVRHFLCFFCKEYLEAFATVPPEHLKGVRVVAIGCSPTKFIRGFQKDTGFPHELYCDPKRDVYNAAGFVRVLGGLGKSPHVKSSVMGGIMKSTWRGIKAGSVSQGDVKQQGGAFVIGPGDNLIYAHQDSNPADHCPIDTLLTQAGLEPFFGPTDGPASGHDASADAK